MSAVRVTPGPVAKSDSLDGVADAIPAPKLDSLMEPMTSSSETALNSRYDSLVGQMDSQHSQLQQLMESQRAIEDRQSQALAEDRRVLQERFQVLQRKLDEQVSLVLAVQQQQNHIVKLINIQDKLAEQDRQLRMFFDYQQNFLATLQSPMAVQAEVFHTLQGNQARMLQSLGSINLPMPTQLPDFSMSYAIPAVLGELPSAPDRRKAMIAAPDPTTKYTNTPALLGGLKPMPNFDADEDAKRLRKAMKGLGSDAAVIANVLGTRANSQRQAIAQAYKTNYKRDLPADLKSETSGNISTLVVALMMTPAVYDSYCIYNAIKGLGTNDNALIEILCSRTPAELRAIKTAYRNEFQREIEGDVIGDTSGDYQNLLIALLRCTRDETNTVDLARAKDDAASLYNAGESRSGTNESIFITILTSRNYAQIRAICDFYIKLDDYELEKSIGRETSFNFRKALITIVKFARSPATYFAEQLHTAMYGIGTNNIALIRVMVSRSEIDLRDIAVAYKAEYKQTLVQKIRSETSGHFKTLLCLLFGDEGFNPEVDAKNLHSAMKGWRNNGDAIGALLAARTSLQRQAIVEAYTSLYKRDMHKDIEAKMTGDFRDLVKAMLQPIDEFLCSEVLRTIKGLGTDDNSLIEILCTRTGIQMRDLRTAYQRVHGRDMAADVRGDTSGDYQKLLNAIISSERDDKEPIDVQKALNEANRLLRAGEEQVGTDVNVFIEVLSRHSLPMLAVIFEQYNKLCDYDIEKSISRETSYNFKRALLAIVSAVRDPALYYAQRLYRTMAGAGTQDRNLIRIIVERSESDLRSINDAFFREYKKTLETMIRGDTSGPYGRLLVRILDRARLVNPPPPAQTAAAIAVANIAAAGVTATPTAAPAIAGSTVVPVLSGSAKPPVAGVGAGAGAGAAGATRAVPMQQQQQQQGGFNISTPSGTVSINPSNRRGENIIAVDNDGDGVADVVFHAPTSTSQRSLHLNHPVSDTHF